MSTKITTIKEAFLEWVNGNYDAYILDDDIEKFLDACRTGSGFKEEPLKEELELQDFAKDFSAENTTELKEDILKVYYEDGCTLFAGAREDGTRYCVKVEEGEASILIAGKNAAGENDWFPPRGNGDELEKWIGFFELPEGIEWA